MLMKSALQMKSNPPKLTCRNADFIPKEFYLPQVDLFHRRRIQIKKDSHTQVFFLELVERFELSAY